MASLLRFALFALLAVAVQVSADVDVTYSTDAGENSVTVDATENVNGIGGQIEIKSDSDDDSSSTKIELGPSNGFQSKLVLPLIPNWEDVMDNINKTFSEINTSVSKSVNEAQNNIESFFKNPFKSIQETFNKVNDDIHDTIKGFLNPNLDFTKMKFDFPGISNFSCLAKNAGGILNQMKEQGAITEQKMNEIGSAIFKSAVNQSENAFALLIDTVENAVNTSLIQASEAQKIIKEAIDSNLQNIVGKSADEIVSEFLNSASAASNIGAEAISAMEDTATSISNAVSVDIDVDVDVDVKEETSDSNSNDDETTETEVKVAVTEESD